MFDPGLRFSLDLPRIIQVFKIFSRFFWFTKIFLHPKYSCPFKARLISSFTPNDFQTASDGFQFLVSSFVHVEMKKLYLKSEHRCFKTDVIEKDRTKWKQWKIGYITLSHRVFAHNCSSAPTSEQVTLFAQKQEQEGIHFFHAQCFYVE